MCFWPLGRAQVAIKLIEKPSGSVIPDLIRDPCLLTTSRWFGCGSSPAGRGLPGGNSLSFASPKESKPRKGDPAVCVPSLRYGKPAVLGPAGAGLELASLRQSPVLIRLNLRSSAHTEGWGEKAGTGTGTGTGRTDAQGVKSDSVSRHVCTRVQRTRPNEVPLHHPAGRGRG
jgi:hypothetical protein